MTRDEFITTAFKAARDSALVAALWCRYWHIRAVGNALCWAGVAVFVAVSHDGLVTLVTWVLFAGFVYLAVRNAVDAWTTHRAIRIYIEMWGDRDE